uniref:Reverse transcriptase domain-containing protein n=1 Tax=Bangia fuscopurpurea TaxID=101920 RepID=A0A0E3JXN6_BANFU|nr:hypothetical protein [Bangia fuscopurpurea]AKA66468.1 hypothetical protein [Bangia fuscopurpurea]
MNKFRKTIFSRLGLSDPKWFYYCPRLMGNTLNIMGYLNLLPIIWKLIRRPARFTKIKIINLNVDNSQPKRNNNSNVGNTGSPKCRQAYGDRVDVVRRIKNFERSTVKSFLNRKLYSTGSTINVERKFESFVKRAMEFPKETIDRDLYRILCDVNFLNIAYNNIKSKPGNMTSGITTETLDGISYDILKDISNSLLKESFHFKPGRRIRIPKPSGGERSLTIASPRDKIVQEAIRIILNAVFEPTFLKSSHGFRPKKSRSTALEKIKLEFKPVTWVIEGDITKCFDNIDHNLLMKLIESKISDRQFTKLISKSFKAGYFETKVISHNIVGTPQGSIISPILCNIFMHQLDVFVENLKNEFDKVVRAKNLSSYENSRYKIKCAKRSGDMIKLKKIYKISQRSPVMDFNDSSYKRLRYIRYADDWIIGIRGSFIETRQVLEKVRSFLSNVMRLDINDSKTKITNLNKDKVVFLGTNIFWSKHVKYSAKSSPSKQRQNLQLQFHVSTDLIRSKLASISMLSGNVPKPRFLWLSLNHDQIIHLYNSVLRGFLNYYSFVGNYSQFVSWIRWVIYSSVAKLLARKFNLSVTKVFKKFGPNLSSGKFALYDPKFIANEPRFKTDVSPVIPNLYAKFKSTATLYELVCAKCGSDHRVEMHYIRKMQNLNPKISEVDRLMVRANRKQIPLCRECHMKYHRNKT